MTYRVVWSESALDRIAQFLDFIAEDNPAAARRVIQDLFDRVQALADHPQLGRRLSGKIDPSLRRFVVGDYILVYQIRKNLQTISIVAIRHHRQRLLREEG